MFKGVLGIIFSKRSHFLVMKLLNPQLRPTKYYLEKIKDIDFDKYAV